MATLLQIAAIVLGLTALVWSADRFVDGAAATARLLGVPPLLVGMVVVGFGTSAPELTVSAFAAAAGDSEIALGNAWGSNICNVALILGLSAAISPLVVPRAARRFDLPVLLGATALSWFLLVDGTLSRADAWILLAVFAAWLGWSVRAALRGKKPAVAGDAPGGGLSGREAAFWTLAGLVVLVASSRALVWGAAGVARTLGTSELLIGLTVVAVGNVIGSNLFNTLAVVGLAGAIRPMETVAPAVAGRDVPVAFALTAALLLVLPVPFVWRKADVRRLARPAGWLLLAAYAGYMAWLLRTETGVA